MSLTIHSPASSSRPPQTLLSCLHLGQGSIVIMDAMAMSCPEDSISQPPPILQLLRGPLSMMFLNLGDGVETDVPFRDEHWVPQVFLAMDFLSLLSLVVGGKECSLSRVAFESMETKDSALY